MKKISLAIIFWILYIPFFILCLAFDIIKLPIVLFILLPIWAIIDFFDYYNFGYSFNLVKTNKDSFYLGLLIAKEFSPF